MTSAARIGSAERSVGSGALISGLTAAVALASRHPERIIAAHHGPLRWTGNWVISHLESFVQRARRPLARGSGPPSRIDPADGEQDSKHDRLGPRGTAGHIDVHGQDLVDASRARVARAGDAPR